MGNRAYVVFENGTDRSPAVYLHWNGGPESIYAFLRVLKDYGADSHSPGYTCARFVQVVDNYLGGNLSLGVQDFRNFEELDCGDNGLYVVTPTGVRRMLDTSGDPRHPTLVWLTPQAVEAEHEQALRHPQFKELLMKTLFYPQELALISDYLAQPRPEACRDIDLWNPPKRRRGIWPQRVKYHDDWDAISNAVARIALGAIQDRLPQWALVNAKGQTILLGRETFDRPERLDELLPQLVLEIDWASSGPGMSWPEVYYATWLPGFDTTVITASVDSAGSYGYTDIAIGHCQGEDLKACALMVLERWWSRRENGWEEFCRSGIVSTDEGYALAAKLWPDEFDVPGGAACGA